MMKKMPNEEQWAVIELLDNAVESAKKLRSITQRLSSGLTAFLNDIETGVYREIASQDYDFIDTPVCYSKVNNMGSEVLGKFNSFYLELEKSPFVDSISSGSDGSEAANNILKKEIKIACINNMLVVKTPHLINRNVTFYNIKGKVVGKDYCCFFAQEVAEVLEENQDILPDFFGKNITVLSVYNDRRRQLPDAENLDSKKIIDEIISYFPGGDRGDCCSIFQLCIRNEEINDGTYFIISEGFAAPPSLDELTDILKNLSI